MTTQFQNIVKYKPGDRILCLCLHPALDVTIYTQDGKETDRTQNIGGKAINLARVLHALGARVTLLTLDDCKKETSTLLADCGFDCVFVPTSLSLRRNQKYVDSTSMTREQNSSAGKLSPQDYAQVLYRLFHMLEGKSENDKFSLLALCGSFPQAVENDVYKSIITRCHAHHISCICDACGMPLSLAVQAKPRLIKPNLQEFCQTFSQDISMLKTQKDVQNAIFDFYGQVRVPILCSMDKDGAIYAGDEGVYLVSGPHVSHVQSFAGAGDTLLAAFIYARMLCAAPIDQSLQFATAAATAKVRLPADTLPTVEQIFEEWSQIHVKRG